MDYKCPNNLCKFHLKEYDLSSIREHEESCPHQHPNRPTNEGDNVDSNKKYQEEMDGSPQYEHKDEDEDGDEDGDDDDCISYDSDSGNDHDPDTDDDNNEHELNRIFDNI
jgi:hypothetical protein